MAEQPEIRPDEENGAATDDLDSLKAKYAALERAHSRLVNDTKKKDAARAELSERLKMWNDIASEHGIEPEQLKHMLAGRAEADIEKAKQSGDRGEVEKIIAQVKAAKDKEIEVERELRRKTATINEKLMIDNVLRVALAKIKVKPSLMDGAFALHRPKIKIVEDPENQEYGQKTVAEVGGDHMSVDDYLKNWAETNPAALDYLEIQMGAGGGAQAGNAAMRGLKKRKDMTAAEKSAYIRTKGKAEYDKLPWS